MKKKNLMMIWINRYNILILLLFLFFICANGFAQDEGIEISNLYLNAADSFYNDNNLERAEVFLEKSLLFYKDSSDSYYLKALIEFKKNSRLDIIISYLKKALVLRNWNFYNEDDAFFELGKLYTVTKDYKKAVSTLYVVENEKSDNEVYLDSYSASLSQCGMFVTASEVLKNAVEKYPDNIVFRKRLLNIDSTYYDKTLLMILDKNELYDFDTEIILEVLKITDDPGIKKELYEMIRDEVSDYPEIILEKIKINNEVTLQDVDDFESYKGFYSLRLIKDMKNLITDDIVNRYFDEKLTKVNGIIYDDQNNDGLYEITFNVAAGSLTWYKMDSNQDGITDVYLDFTDDEIESAEFDEKYFIKYYRYPVIEKIIVNNKDIDIYTFPDKRTFFDITVYRDIFNIPEIISNYPAEINNLLKKAAVHQKTTGDNMSLYVDSRKNERITVSREIYQDRIVSEGIIKDKKTVSVKKDNNSDSSFETKEIYKNGKLDEIMYDGDNDGIYELKVGSNIKYWDYNGDGIYDLVASREGDTLLTRYSTMMDGNFDITEKRVDGKIKSIMKSDKWYNVVYDEKNKIFWIDQAIKGAVIENLKDNSFITINGSQVYIYKVAENYYAEVVN